MLDTNHKFTLDDVIVMILDKENKPVPLIVSAEKTYAVFTCATANLFLISRRPEDKASIAYPDTGFMMHFINKRVSLITLKIKDFTLSVNGQSILAVNNYSSFEAVEKILTPQIVNV